MSKEKIKKKSDFWDDIIYKNGKMDEKAVLAELSDYEHILEEVPKVYCEITNHQMSKPNYYANDVISKFEELFWDKGIIQDDVKAILDDEKMSAEEKLEEIKDYLEI